MSKKSLSVLPYFTNQSACLLKWVQNLFASHVKDSIETIRINGKHAQFISCSSQVVFRKLLHKTICIKLHFTTYTMWYVNILALYQNSCLNFFKSLTLSRHLTNTALLPYSWTFKFWWRAELRQSHNQNEQFSIRLLLINAKQTRPHVRLEKTDKVI